jgi:Trk K+ transport system NAD-binding subunit
MNFKKFTPLFYTLSIVAVFYFAFTGYHNAMGEDFQFWDVLFSIISIFLLKYSVNSPRATFTETNIIIAKYLALIVLFVGLISVFLNRIKEIWKHYRIKFFIKEHIIVFSLDAVGYQIVKELLLSGYKVVVVINKKDSPFLDEIERMGGILIQSNPFEIETYNLIGLINSRACILVHENDEINIEIAGNISQALYQEKTNTAFSNRDAIKLLIHIKDHQNKNVVRDYFDVDNSSNHFDLRIINFEQMAAQNIYDDFPPHAYFKNSNNQDDSAIAIIGNDKTAESFLLENIILSHYENHIPLKIYLLDKEADKFYDNFTFQYPFHKNFVELIPIKLLNANFFDNFTNKKEYIDNLSKISIAYVFGDADAAVINSAGAFRQFLYSNTSSPSHLPILVSIPEKTPIFHLINDINHNKNKFKTVFQEQFNHHFIRRKSDVFSGKSIIEEGEIIDMISRVINFYYTVCYEFSYLIKLNHEIIVSNETIEKLSKYIIYFTEDNTHFSEQDFENAFLTFMATNINIEVNELYKWATIKKNWNNLNIRKKESNRYAARHIQVKLFVLDSINCTPVTPDNIIKFYPQLAKLEHYRWSSEKMVFNYQYGEYTKNIKEKPITKEILKIHDQLIPYEELTEEEKYKDLNLFLLLPLIHKLRSSLNKF